VTNKIENQEKKERFYLEEYLKAPQIQVESIEHGANPPPKGFSENMKFSKGWCGVYKWCASIRKLRR
jgi:hypothetical protein